jgi:alkylation response protein AidB-like acyl-CoA dehydrogenase
VALDLAFDDAQQAIQTAVARFCRDRCGDRALDARAGRFASELWQGLAQLGVLALATPEGDGGAVELVAAAEALGHAVFPGPLAASVLAGQLLPARERVQIGSGAALVCVGRPPLLPWAPLAQLFIELDGERAWLAHARGRIESVETLGGEPWGRVELVRDHELGGARRALALHDLVLAAYLAAAGNRLVEDAAAHARTRRQFGRAIGEFQAVAHPLADCWTGLAAAATLARAAACRFDAEPSGEDFALAAAARLSASRAALAAAHAGHQVFGAVGITLEGPVFHVSRRIRQLATHPLGDAPARAAVLAAFEA